MRNRRIRIILFLRGTPLSVNEEGGGMQKIALCRRYSLNSPLLNYETFSKVANQCFLLSQSPKDIRVEMAQCQQTKKDAEHQGWIHTEWQYTLCCHMQRFYCISLSRH
ncbi:hypothetical protein KP509_09G094200 [Ceratopteris richardii]|uniref:Uncharacterized protein n=1 Tax=Ceratopteris richardii TaxID=49495 RepID=A0A8T2U8U3_CERRI|nr:hypothetical protein KP509_09G094200 [Ceratopteris richardii]